jgi:MFS family permease
MFTNVYRRYVLATLTLVYTLNSLDVPLMTLLLQPIKTELGLSDGQLGFLTGIAFALFYATLGVPIARWVDRGNRVTITSVAVGLWGAAVMLCVLVGSFGQLVLARMAAAVGASGSMPPTYSLLGDYFPAAAERTRAMAIYMLSGPLAPLISFVAGGWLNEHYGWRIALFAAGVPGILFAMLVRMTIREPRTIADVSNLPRPVPPTAEVLATLWNQRATRHLTVAIILFYAEGLGLSPWVAAFMMRSHGMGTSDLGVWLGLIWGVGGIVGVLLGGHLSELWFAGDERRQMRLVALLTASLVPGYLLLLYVPRKEQALIVMVPLMMVANSVFGPTFALLQRLVVDEMRATALAIVMLLANLIGMGVGPQMVGTLSDLLVPFTGIDSLRYAMMTVSLLALCSAYHFWKVGKTVKADLAAVPWYPRQEPHAFILDNPCPNRET